jgi:hypothetical protein
VNVIKRNEEIRDQQDHLFSLLLRHQASALAEDFPPTPGTGHGPILIDNDKNSILDLDAFSGVEFFGYSHPLYLRSLLDVGLSPQTQLVSSDISCQSLLTELSKLFATKTVPQFSYDLKISFPDISYFHNVANEGELADAISQLKSGEGIKLLVLRDLSVSGFRSPEQIKGLADSLKAKGIAVWIDDPFSFMRHQSGCFSHLCLDEHFVTLGLSLGLTVAWSPTDFAHKENLSALSLNFLTRFLRLVREGMYLGEMGRIAQLEHLIRDEISSKSEGFTQSGLILFADSGLDSQRLKELYIKFSTQNHASAFFFPTSILPTHIKRLARALAPQSISKG